MGFFRDLLARWFGGARPPRAAARPAGEAGLPPEVEAAAGKRWRAKKLRPKEVIPLGENSPMVAFVEGGATVVMDRDSFDYTYGDADGPDPAQRDLDELLPRVTRVCVLSGGLFRGRALGGDVLLDVDDPGAVRALAGGLRIVGDPRTFGHCCCLGGPTLELYAGRELLATFGLQHGRAVRWARWYHDGQLEDGGRLDRWLTDHGVDPGQLRSIYQRGGNYLMGEPEPASEPERQARGLVSQAQERAHAGALAEALDLCTRALGLHADAGGYGLRGLIHHALNRHEEAAADCGEAIRRGLRNPEVYFTRGVANDLLGRPEEALADFSMALHLKPDHPGAHNSRALLWARLGRAEEALAGFAEAVRLAPDWYLPYLNRAPLHERRGDWDGAAADYSAAARLLEAAGGGPADGRVLAVIYVSRGRARQAKGQLAEARADYEQALRGPPGFVDALSARGWLRLREQQVEEAFADFTEVIRLAGAGGWRCVPVPAGRGAPSGAQAIGPASLAEAYAQRAQAHLTRGEAARALEDLDAALAVEPDTYLFGMRGQARMELGRHDEALEDFAEVIRREPRDPRAYQLRARILGLRGDHGREQAELEAALAHSPDDVAVCNLAAWRLATCPDARFRDGAKAVALASRACAQTGWEEPHCLDTLAAACAEAGQFDQACRWQEKALGLFPPDIDLQPYRARLEGYRAGRPHRESAAAE
jgi:tetratricopeptide (TPR) repeat protein